MGNKELLADINNKLTPIKNYLALLDEQTKLGHEMEDLIAEHENQRTGYLPDNVRKVNRQLSMLSEIIREEKHRANFSMSFVEIAIKILQKHESDADDKIKQLQEGYRKILRVLEEDDVTYSLRIKLLVQGAINETLPINTKHHELDLDLIKEFGPIPQDENEGPGD